MTALWCLLSLCSVCNNEHVHEHECVLYILLYEATWKTVIQYKLKCQLLILHLSALSTFSQN